MPTFFRSTSFLNDWRTLTPEQKRAFKAAVRVMVADLRAKQPFQASLRVKRVQKVKGVYEMTWALDGRATFEFGPPRIAGEVYIIWRRIGGHDIFKQP